eukprot:scaffold20999_cov81-Phaeocystis_antarctica.AAC.1
MTIGSGSGSGLGSAACECSAALRSSSFSCSWLGSRLSVRVGLGLGLGLTSSRSLSCSRASIATAHSAEGVRGVCVNLGEACAWPPDAVPPPSGVVISRHTDPDPGPNPDPDPVAPLSSGCCRAASLVGTSRDTSRDAPPLLGDEAGGCGAAAITCGVAACTCGAAPLRLRRRLASDPQPHHGGRL